MFISVYNISIWQKWYRLGDVKKVFHVIAFKVPVKRSTVARHKKIIKWKHRRLSSWNHSLLLFLHMRSDRSSCVEGRKGVWVKSLNLANILTSKRLVVHCIKWAGQSDCWFWKAGKIDITIHFLHLNGVGRQKMFSKLTIQQASNLKYIDHFTFYLSRQMLPPVLALDVSNEAQTHPKCTSIIPGDAWLGLCR